MAGKCLRCHSENAGEEAAFASGICKINGYFPFIATLRLRMNRAGVMVILWEPTPGLGIPDGFSLHIFHSSNVFKIFHTNISPGNCVKGGRAEGT